MIVAALILAVAVEPARQLELEHILDAIERVESGGETNGGRDAVGDGGRSIGPFQIQRAYWIDSGVAGRFEDCRDALYARRVVLAYWSRWCPAALANLDFETLARVHNGGPRGMRKVFTQGYWKRVHAELMRQPSASYARAPRSSSEGGISNSPRFLVPNVSGCARDPRVASRL